MSEQMGRENIFIFGNTVEQIEAIKRDGYNPSVYYEALPELQEAVEQIRSGYFSPFEPDLFTWLMDDTIQDDRFCILADFRAYLDCQLQVEKTFMVSVIDKLSNVFRLKNALLGQEVME